jgi:HEAT repeat protein
VRRWFVILILFAWLIVPALPAQAAPAYTAECTAARDRLVEDPLWYQHLLDPVLSSTAEIQARAAIYRPIHDCLERSAFPPVENYDRLYEWSGYFLELAAPLAQPGAGSAARATDIPSGTLVSFADLQDPAIIKLRDLAKIPVPQGYVYLWTFPSRVAMPESLRTFFADPAVRGITLLTRYVIILDDAQARSGGNAGLARFYQDQRAEVVSHELVHAYTKSVIGPQNALALPEWFNEGLAVYFSETSQKNSYTFYESGGLVTVTSSTPDNYLLYRDAFRYLAETYGQERFYAVLRETLSTGDPAVLYRPLGIANEDELLRLAGNGEENRFRLAGLGVFVAGAGAGFLLTRRARKVYAEIRRGRSTRPALGERADALQALPQLLSALADPDAVVRAAAARALGERSMLIPVTGEATAVDPAAAALDDERDQVPAALKTLLEQDSNEEVGIAAAEALYQIVGPEALRSILDMVKKGGHGLQSWFTGWSANLGMDYLLIALYPSADAGVRQQIVEKLSDQLTPAARARLSAARATGDPALVELADAVLGG